MKKKLLSIVLALSMLCAFVPLVASAEVATSGTCGEKPYLDTWRGRYTYNQRYGGYV